MGQQQSCCSGRPDVQRGASVDETGRNKMPSTFSSDGGRATLSVNVDADADDDAMERELLEDIVPWSPWKAAVVALKRKQHDRSELSECTTDLIVDESPFSFIFQLSELLRTTTKELGNDPASTDFCHGLRCLTKQPAGCRLLGLVAPIVEREALEDALSSHLLPLPGSRERWLRTVRVTAEVNLKDTETGADVSDETVQAGETLQLLQTGFASPTAMVAVLNRAKDGSAVERYYLVRSTNGARLVTTSKVVLEEGIEETPSNGADDEYDHANDSDMKRNAATEEGDSAMTLEETSSPEPQQEASSHSSQRPSEASELPNRLVLKHRETLGNLRHKKVDGDGAWARREKRRITLSSTAINFFRRMETVSEKLDTESLSPTSSASEVFIRFLDHVHSTSGLENVQKAFDEMDTNSDGELDEEELYNGLQKAGISVTESMVSQVLWAVDVEQGDSNDKISPTEFVAKLAAVSAEWTASFSEDAGSIMLDDCRCEYDPTINSNAFKVFSKGYEYEVRVGSDAEAAAWAAVIKERAAAAGLDKKANQEVAGKIQPTPYMFSEHHGAAVGLSGLGASPVTADHMHDANVEAGDDLAVPAPGAFRAIREIALMYAAQKSTEDGGRQFMNDFVADKLRACLATPCRAPFYRPLRMELAREMGGLAAAAHDCDATNCFTVLQDALQALATDPDVPVREICARMLPSFSKCKCPTVYTAVAAAYARLAVDTSLAVQKSLLRHTQQLAEGFQRTGDRSPPPPLLAGFVRAVSIVEGQLRTLSQPGALDTITAETEARDGVEATLDACLALLKAAGRARWSEIAAGLESLLRLATEPNCAPSAASMVVGQVAKRLHFFTDQLHTGMSPKGADGKINREPSDDCTKTLQFAARVCMSELCPRPEQRQLHCRLASILFALDEEDRQQVWLDRMVGAYDYYLDPRSQEIDLNGASQPAAAEFDIPDIARLRKMQEEQQLQARRHNQKLERAECACVLAYNLPAAVELSCRLPDAKGYDTRMWEQASRRNGQDDDELQRGNGNSLSFVHTALCQEEDVRVRKSLASSLPVIAKLVGAVQTHIYTPRIFTTLLYGADTLYAPDTPRCNDIEVEVKDVLLSQIAKLAGTIRASKHATRESKRAQSYFLWLLARVPHEFCVPGCEIDPRILVEDAPWGHFPATAAQHAHQLGACASLCAKHGYRDDEIAALQDDSDAEDGSDDDALSSSVSNKFAAWPPPTVERFSQLSLILLEKGQAACVRKAAASSVAEILDVLEVAGRPIDSLSSKIVKLANAQVYWQRLLFLWVCEAAADRVAAQQAAAGENGWETSGCATFCERVMGSTVVRLSVPETEKVLNVRTAAERTMAKWKCYLDGAEKHP